MVVGVVVRGLVGSVPALRMSAPYYAAYRCCLILLPPTATYCHLLLHCTPSPTTATF